MVKLSFAYDVDTENMVASLKVCSYKPRKFQVTLKEID